MRILQVMESTLGGTRRYLEDVANALGTGEHLGLIYSLVRADAAFLRLLEKLRSAGWSLFEVDMRREISPRHDLRCLAEIRTIYRAFQPDVVHAHSSKAGALSRLATIGMRRRPGVIYAPHSIASNVSRVYGLIEKVLALRVDVVSAVSQSEREELRLLDLVVPERVRVIVPTISETAFAPRDRDEARAALGLGDEPMIVGVGRMTKQKDPLAFVEIAAALRDEIPTLRAVWVGDGELRGAVEARVAEFGLTPCFTITGWLEDVRPYMAAANVFVSTSRYESFGYVTAEAISMGRPVVATRITGTVDVVKVDMAEQLFALGDTPAATRKASAFLNDPALADEVGSNGRAVIGKAFSSEETRRGLLSAYDAALSIRGTAPRPVFESTRTASAPAVDVAQVGVEA